MDFDQNEHLWHWLHRATLKNNIWHVSRLGAEVNCSFSLHYTVVRADVVFNNIMRLDGPCFSGVAFIFIRWKLLFWPERTNVHFSDG